MDLGSIPYANNLTAEQVDRVRRLVEANLSLEDRWLEYGKAYGSGAAGGDSLSRVKQMVRDRLGELQKVLCGDELLKVIGAPATGAALSLAFMVTGKLVASQFHDVDVVQLGVLIAQCGIFAICSGKL